MKKKELLRRIEKLERELGEVYDKIKTLENNQYIPWYPQSPYPVDTEVWHPEKPALPWYPDVTVPIYPLYYYYNDGTAVDPWLQTVTNCQV